ncbi:MAG TPA: NAD-binding protein [Candidatus Agrococcus pullicola]|uniref:NAD-binding protein n=1 Tax=Candidatus Agrococcus pullicola TaxID=2838429 RepID=A0A9D1YS02_9MICO|nr:NAD-binding protein [Candidatus Agrococcus pullicola]
MTTIAFVGLGIMGRPMAANLARAGHAVTATTRTEASRQAAADVGVHVVASIAELPASIEVVVLMLPDAPQVEEVLFGSDGSGADGLIAHLDAPTTILDMTTLSPIAARDFAARTEVSGHRYVDAPVSGGEQGAIDGVLSVMVGADQATVDELSPVLEAVGKTFVPLGAVGSGQVVKAANQLIVAGNLQLLAEAIVLIEANGVETSAALDVIGGGLAGSTALDRKRSALLDRNFAPGFRLALHHKDLGIVAASARAADVSLPLTGIVSQLVQSLVARGDGDLDHSALLKLAEELNGRAE